MRALYTLFASAITKVNGPMRPRNIKNIISNLPKIVNCGVMPVDNPTVPNAETVSNNRSRYGFRSTDKSTKKIRDTTMSALTNSATAFNTLEVDIVFL